MVRAPSLQRVLLFFFAAPLFALTVTVSATSPTQAILSYVAPDSQACTVEVSESATYTPLVHDVDPAIFAGGNLDSRTPGALSSGTSRVFLVGARIIGRSSFPAGGDFPLYSRALQN